MLYGKLSGFADEISPAVDEQFAAFNRLGIKYYEPRGIDGRNIADLSEDEVNELKSKMDEYGIKASSIGSPIGKIKITDDFCPHFEVFKRIVKTAKTLGTKYIRMFSFYKDGEWDEEKRNEVFKRLSEMISYAKEQDVVLLCENEKDIYGDIDDRCLELMEELSCDNFKMVFDPANFVQSGVDTKEAFNKLYPYVEYMHIKDSLKDGLVVPAGEGDGNVEYILKELFAKGYDGFLSLEPHLGTFVGLQNLELDDKMLKLEKASESTFAIALSALEKILNRM